MDPPGIPRIVHLRSSGLADAREHHPPSHVTETATLTFAYTQCPSDLLSIELPTGYASQVASGLDWVPFVWLW